jgi:hypothetical protein
MEVHASVAVGQEPSCANSVALMIADNMPVDSMCHCGHLASEHVNGLDGACVSPGCPCQHYMWDYFVDKDGKRWRRKHWQN